MKYDRILACGSRTWRGYKIIAAKLEKYAHEDTVIITGKAPGADSLAEWWAICTQHDYMGFPARWKTQGKAAGAIRNKRMLWNGLGVSSGMEVPDLPPEGVLVLAFHDDYENSKGTKQMVELAQSAGVTVKLIREGNLTDQVIDGRNRR